MLPNDIKTWTFEHLSNSITMIKSSKNVYREMSTWPTLTKKCQLTNNIKFDACLTSMRNINMVTSFKYINWEVSKWPTVAKEIQLKNFNIVTSCKKKLIWETSTGLKMPNIQTRNINMEHETKKAPKPFWQ